MKRERRTGKAARHPASSHENETARGQKTDVGECRQRENIVVAERQRSAKGPDRDQSGQPASRGLQSIRRRPIVVGNCLRLMKTRYQQKQMDEKDVLSAGSSPLRKPRARSRA